MVYKVKNEKNGKDMYLCRFGNMYVLSYDKKKTAVDEVPEGWEIISVDGVPKLRRAK